MKQSDGKTRTVIDYVGPQIDAGKFPIKRVVGEEVAVKAYIFCDGHDQIRAELLYRKARRKKWNAAPMKLLVNDEWTGRFEVTELGTYYYTVQAWIDHFASWQKDLQKKAGAGQKVATEHLIGSQIVGEIAGRASAQDRGKLRSWAKALRTAKGTRRATRIALSKALTNLAERYPGRTMAVRYPIELAVRVNRPKALFSSWYELFPRSCGKDGQHGTFADCAKLLPEIAKMGFDTVYLPPIHPIGRTNRKGKNNSPTCKPDDPGSPWAIGSKECGHKSVHTQLGTLQDFRKFVRQADKQGLGVALDLAFQCSPDHPYVKAHPQWFRWRPDGTVQYAENPPKKYEDILPFNFETDQWLELWKELKSIVEFWIKQGVRIYRVDNPHTKPFAFWEWLIAQVRKKHPGVIFLAEAFTRPKVMQRLAKVGFDQSYNYFTWRNSKHELTQYLTELTPTEVGEYMRPNFWPNTPDILPQYLQFAGKAAFIARLVLAATLSSSYGIYGPAFELCVSEGMEGKEEYLNSEKYEIKNWDRNQPGNIRPVVERINRIRRENPALQETRNLRFFDIDNDMMLCYGKQTEDQSNVIIVVVNLDPHHKQAGWIKLPLDQLDVDSKQSYLLHDLLSDDKYIWQGQSNYLELDPRVMPAHILKLQKKLRRETDFDYYM